VRREATEEPSTRRRLDLWRRRGHQGLPRGQSGPHGPLRGLLAVAPGRSEGARWAMCCYLSCAGRCGSAAVQFHADLAVCVRRKEVGRWGLIRLKRIYNFLCSMLVL
jgi:hypothetical protein